MKEDITDQKLVNTLSEHHGQFGARVLEKWKYGDSYISCALYHEDLDSPETGELIDEDESPAELLIVNIANHMAKSLGFDLNRNEPRELDLEDIESAKRLKLTSKQIEKTRETVIEEMKGVDELF